MTAHSGSAVIIGASGGIGRAVAADLTQLGIGVVLVGRNLEKLQQTRSSLGAAGKDAPVILCDITDREQVKAMVEQATSLPAPVDTLFCSAGMNVKQRSLRSLEPNDWDHVLAANLTGTFNVLHYFLPHMRARGSGLIIQMSSVSGLRANTVSGVAYSAAKFAQSALGICIGREERGRGIRSTLIYAGEVNTEFLDVRPGRPGGGEDSRRQNILQPEDIAAAVRFLVQLPPRVHIPELVVKPAIDDFF